MTDPSDTASDARPRVPRRALKWAFVMNWGQRGLATIFTVVLAALLGPHDFGVVALALVYVAFIDLFVEQGVVTAIVQRKDLDDAHLHSAFWINLAWCIVLAGVSVALSGPWARANDLPELEGVIDVLSITIVLWAFTIVQRALLERGMEFRKLAIRANVGAFVGGCVGVGLAIAGAGVWALVGQQLALTVTSVVLFFVLGRWVPRFRFSRHHARELFSFSVSVFAANVAGFLSRRSDILLMGLFFSPVVVGIYRLADRLVDTLLELSVRPVGLISLPHFSRLQDDPEGLRRSVGSCLRLALFLVIPAMLVLASCSQYVLGILGSKWSPGVDALRLLALVGIVKAIIFFTGPLLFALGRPAFRAIMLWGQAALSAGVVVAAGLVLAGSSVEDQLTGTAGSRALLFLLVFLPANLLIVTHLTGLRMREVVVWFPVPVASGLVAIAAVALVGATGVLDGLSPAPALLVAGSVAVATALGSLIVLEREVRDETLVLLRRGRAFAGSAAEPEPADVPGDLGFESESLLTPSADR